MISLFLLQQNYQVLEAEDYQSAVKKLSEKPKLILLDWMLPGRSGIQFIQYLKKSEETAQIPILMLTARSSEDDCIVCLNTGADDYVTKPFSPKVLIARIESLLRRTYQNNDIINIDDLILVQNAKRITFQKKEISLSSTEYKLLHFFMTHPEKVYSREQLLDFVWGNDIYVEDRTVDSYIRRLRKSLEPCGFERYVQTVRGSGYRFSNHFQDN
ncbi:phosphate regulon transcriptional regulator PhoB [Actinobacillus pleuropneumoniae]|uniref:Phosphate regulon transcriptional regulatory protein PhoB n=1 Tax=Actinobacillus pleuropneumoniae serotype 7 (strain AP76) TaxID=537457 RepID=B3H228_ACTP7|nr:phosphate regulon transcriptional regulator PhoB [Actinobacillus pleuropneumoniae]EFN02525.1 Phosphate regulon transcriptional regulatory protein phoB [Actinobacillus pleuropneumoniae serovar 13 str. N273]CUU52576.1 phosphate regulon transcriptional regulatory protein [Actinobacillus pleuropneumoniae serovar 8]ACE61958.1 phosphate regulon transcriptional regulatory protein PhoB [Actinobacillus pleuropneumoniae serovar 7 str. AP76]KIE90236.1 putative phosphate regulon transcriptional regulato